MAASMVHKVSARMVPNIFLRFQPVRSCFYNPHHRGQVRVTPKPLEVEEKEGDGPPHMLHAVSRTNSTRKRPYWEKDVIEELGLTVMGKVVILKNTPSINEKLQAVKHLVRIQPVILKHGLPQNSDYDNTLLKHNGEFVLMRKVDTVDRTEPASEIANDVTELNTERSETS